MSSAPDHIYLDLFTLNSDNKGTGVRTALNFTESRTTNILDNPSNYFMSVVRFQADPPAVGVRLRSLPVEAEERADGPRHAAGRAVGLRHAAGRPDGHPHAR